MSDLISRAEAIEAVRGLRVKEERSGDFIYNAGLRSAERILTEIPSAEAEQVTDKLKNPCNSLLTEDSEDSKEQKSKLDLISRADAKARFMDELFERSGKSVQEILDEVPSAERVGEWIDRERCQVDEDAYEVAICSSCKAEITLEYPHDNYCPNCGARMENKK